MDVRTLAPNVLKEVDAKVHKTRIIGGSLLQFVVGITMIWVGGMHSGDCELDVTLYLVCKGTAGVIMGVAIIMAVQSPVKCHDKLVEILIPSSLFVQFCMAIWGAIVVFGNYASWQNGSYECNTCAYLFAFAYQIIYWIGMPTLLFVLAFFICPCW